MYLNKKVGRVETRPPGTARRRGCMYGRRAFPLGTLLRVSEWKRDELGRVTGLHPHQDGVSAL
jgi:hypothetical protein